jgi:superfamily II DNA/RNA helicase
LSRVAERSFADLGVSASVIDALAKRQINGAFAIQELVLRDAIAGRDVLARSQTGSGKTLAFAIPIVEQLIPTGRSPSALILVPTRELASQVAEEFRAIADVKRLAVTAVYGGVGITEQAKRARRSDILIATPGRLLDLVARRLLRLDRVRICVLDEADRMLDMGFLPDVNRILELLRPERQTMLFSATLDGEVGRLAKRFTENPVMHEVADERPTVTEATHRFIAVEQPDKMRALVRELAADRGLTLIFVRTKRGADRLARNLKQQGFKVGALHGDMSQPQRERALGHFAAGRNDVLVATDVAARGLDLEHISHVVNYDPPGDEKAYVHRVGRTARAGRGGEGITFVTPQQVDDVRAMAHRLDLHAEFGRTGFRSGRARPDGPPPSGQPRSQKRPRRRR